MDFSIEQKHIKSGRSFVIGIDEAGRGPLAGPVVAAALFLSPDFNFHTAENQKEFLKIKDSKKITPKGREKLFDFLTASKDIKYGIGIVTEKTIDEKNILQATLIAMKKAVDDLLKKDSKINIQNSVVLIDGRDIVDDLDFDQKAIIGGDDKVWSIAAASIIAKVTRDKIMEKYHEKYPQYCFDKHKGYGTKLHFEMIEKYGPCEIHRKTFID